MPIGYSTRFPPRCAPVSGYECALLGPSRTVDAGAFTTASAIAAGILAGAPQRSLDRTREFLRVSPALNG